MSVLPLRSLSALDREVPAPPCPACAIAMLPAGTGRRSYWLCSDCGTAMHRH